MVQCSLRKFLTALPPADARAAGTATHPKAPSLPSPRQCGSPLLSIFSLLFQGKATTGFNDAIQDWLAFVSVETHILGEAPKITNAGVSAFSGNG